MVEIETSNLLKPSVHNFYGHQILAPVKTYSIKFRLVTMGINLGKYQFAFCPISLLHEV